MTPFNNSKIDIFESDGIVAEFVPLEQPAIDALFAALEKRGIKPGSFLDAGSGDGRIVAAAASRGFKAVGIELNPVLYERSIKHLTTLETKENVPKGSWQVACGNFLEESPYAQLGIALNAFDIVFNFHSYGQELLEKLLKHRKPLLFIYVSSQQGLQGAKIDATVKLSDDPRFPLTLYFYRIY